jgi:hypothetical protein
MAALWGYEQFKHGKTCDARAKGYPDLGCAGCRAMLAARRRLRETQARRTAMKATARGMNPKRRRRRHHDNPPVGTLLLLAVGFFLLRGAAQNRLPNATTAPW